MDSRAVAVYGANGYTGRFVVAELRRRGLVPVLSGRDPVKLAAVAAQYPGAQVRAASIDDANSLDRALRGSAAVINCAGPFARTGVAVVEAALRARIPYIDVAAEVDAVLDMFAGVGDRARAAGIAVLPAMAFYGGLGDLLVTAAMGDWPDADQAHIAYGLDSWYPTNGTRDTFAVIMASLAGRVLTYRQGQLAYRAGEAPIVAWTFPDPMGEVKVIGDFSLADIVTVPSHLAIAEVRGYIPVQAMTEAMTPDTPPPVAVDDRGRSAQQFLVDVVVRRGTEQRRASARGQDAYAITAPLAVEAVHRILDGAPVVGVVSAGAAFNALEFLRALAPDLSVEVRW